MLLFDRRILPWPIVNSELYYEHGVDDLPTYGIKRHDVRKARPRRLPATLVLGGRAWDRAGRSRSI
jgi:hypothetical protein